MNHFKTVHNYNRLFDHIEISQNLQNYAFYIKLNFFVSQCNGHNVVSFLLYFSFGRKLKTDSYFTFPTAFIQLKRTTLKNHSVKTLFAFFFFYRIEW